MLKIHRHKYFVYTIKSNFDKIHQNLENVQIIFQLEIHTFFFQSLT